MDAEPQSLERPAVCDLMENIVHLRDSASGGDPIYDWYVQGIGPRGLWEATQRVYHEIQDVYVAEYGASVSWPGEEPEEGWGDRRHLSVFGFDDGDQYPDWLDPYLEWSETPLARVAFAYKRECHWDFPPNDSGLWVCVMVPDSVIGGGDVWRWFGNLAGFLILQNRSKDGDGDRDSLAHIWVARQYRRQGLAMAMLEEAKRRVEVRHIEQPVTEDGEAFLRTWIP
jgi:ribosomal protein S18 acetylase RimI-like enzyme